MAAAYYSSAGSAQELPRGRLPWTFERLFISCSKHWHKVYLVPSERFGDACLPQVWKANQPEEVRAPPETVRLSAQAQVQSFAGLERFPHEDLTGRRRG